MPDLTGIADELYALDLDDFTATRNDRAKQLRGDDRTLSDAVKALPKPSAAAWAANLLVRERSAEIDQLLELGATLQEAQEDLDAATLRTLTKQRRQLVSALARQAADLTEERGHRINPGAVTEVEATLHAALSDPEAGTALRTARLTRSLRSSGLDPVDLTDAVAGDPGTARPRPKREKKDDGRARELALARQELDEAEQALDQARDRQTEADERVDELRAERAKLEEELEELRRRLAELRRSVRDAEDEASAASDAVDDAETAADDARERVDRLSAG